MLSDRVREAHAAGVLRFARVGTKENVADVMTKPLANDLHQSVVKPYLFRNPATRYEQKQQQEEKKEPEAKAEKENETEKLSTLPGLGKTTETT